MFVILEVVVIKIKSFNDLIVMIDRWCKNTSAVYLN